MQAIQLPTYQESLTTARERLALALTFTDNNPLKAQVLNGAKRDIAYYEAKLAECARRAKLEAEHAADVAAYKALPFFKRIFARNPSH